MRRILALMMIVLIAGAEKTQAIGLLLTTPVIKRSTYSIDDWGIVAGAMISLAIGIIATMANTLPPRWVNDKHLKLFDVITTFIAVVFVATGLLLILAQLEKNSTL